MMRIVEYALNLDTVQVRSYADALALKLECTGDTWTADRLRQLLKENEPSIRLKGAA